MIAEKWYKVGDMSFKQMKIVLGQGEHLASILRGVKIDMKDTQALLESVSKNLPELLACVLLKEGETRAALVKLLDSPEQRKERIELMKGEMTYELAFEVARDFFDINQIGSFSEKMLSTTSGLFENLKSAQKSSTPSSAEAIPQAVA